MNPNPEAHTPIPQPRSKSCIPRALEYYFREHIVRALALALTLALTLTLTLKLTPTLSPAIGTDSDDCSKSIETNNDGDPLLVDGKEVPRVHPSCTGPLAGRLKVTPLVAC